MQAPELKVTVLDMQPIDPPTGGGRIRLIGLYHALGKNMPTTYVGTYDWPGEKYRKHFLSDTLEEIDIPLSDEHFSAAEEWKKKAGGKTIIDTAFHQQAHLSPDYVAEANKRAAEADIVVFSHPWIYPLVKESLDKSRQLIVYESHNVEGYLRTALLDDGGLGSEIAREAVRVEYELCHYADLILTCSHEDRLMFNKLFKTPVHKMKVVPNGVFTSKITPADSATKIKFKDELGLPHNLMAIFLASAYPPNVEAAEFIVEELAPAYPGVTFVIAGGVGNDLDKDAITKKYGNVRITGFLSEEDKIKILRAADVAVNPMFSGSGTNIKMFDFMAAGLPTISTPTGARGIQLLSTPSYELKEEQEFVSGLQPYFDREEDRFTLGANARQYVEEKFSWERISPNLGALLRRYHKLVGKKTPFYTVITPSYERPDYLDHLLDNMQKQEFKDFEMVIVDQSAEPWPGADKDWGIDLFYYHTDIKGAVKARNTGGFFAAGEVIAFTDDDCQPYPGWLKSARPLFNNPDVSGVEGFIKSEKRDDPNFRTVTNEGFEGIGFMTANLFVRNSVFSAINGFDEIFDRPHFREDSDLGWRVQQYGEVPFCKEAAVFHPPHPREVARESEVERAKFFEKDPLLMVRYPEQYRKLFHDEAHWEKTEGFWENFLRGCRKYNIEIPEEYLRYLASWAMDKFAPEA